jgi:hypothetical protein
MTAIRDALWRIWGNNTKKDIYNATQDVRYQTKQRLQNQYKNILEAKNLFDKLPEWVKVEYKYGQWVDLQKNWIQEVTVIIVPLNSEAREIHLNIEVTWDQIIIREKNIKQEIEDQRKTSKSNNEAKTPENIIYNEVVKNLIPIKFSYKWENPIPIAFCDKDLVQRLNNNDFIFDFLWEDEKIQSLELEINNISNNLFQLIFRRNKIKTLITKFLNENYHIKKWLDNFWGKLEWDNAEDKLRNYLKKKYSLLRIRQN